MCACIRVYGVRERGIERVMERGSVPAQETEARGKVCTRERGGDGAVHVMQFGSIAREFCKKGRERRARFILCVAYVIQFVRQIVCSLQCGRAEIGLS